MILVIDNYDSFTYNLVHQVYRFAEGKPVEVIRNDKISLLEIEEMAPSGILISPGPGRPSDAGVTNACVQRFGKDIPVFGVCLGHQAIGEVFGATVTYAPNILHGKTSLIQHDDKGVFKGIEQDFVATRYHSLTLDPATIPDELEVTAHSADGVIMGVRHKSFPIEGVQFHPESVLTERGDDLVCNWVTSVYERAGQEASA